MLTSFFWRGHVFSTSMLFKTKKKLWKFIEIRFCEDLINDCFAKKTTDRYKFISRVLDSHNGNILKTAKALNISNNCVKTVIKWMEADKPPLKQPEPLKILVDAMR